MTNPRTLTSPTKLLFKVVKHNYSPFCPCILCNEQNKKENLEPFICKCSAVGEPICEICKYKNNDPEYYKKLIINEKLKRIPFYLRPGPFIMTVPNSSSSCSSPIPIEELIKKSKSLPNIGPLNK